MNAEASSADPWTRLLGAAAHELRQEVSAVLHQVELLKDTALDERIRERSLRAVETNAEHLLSFVAALGDLERISSHEAEPATCSVEVADLVATLLSDHPDRLERTPPVSAMDESARWSVSVDPTVVGHVVAEVLDQYDRHGHGGEKVGLTPRPPDGGFVDVVFALRSEELPDGDGLRVATPDDGLAVFVAHRWVELFGGAFGPLPTPSGDPAAYLLRLPSAGTMDRAGQG